MEQLLTLWVGDLNQKRFHLTQRAIAAKARRLFEEIQQKKLERRYLMLTKDGLQGSSNTRKLIAQKLVERLLVPTLK